MFSKKIIGAIENEKEKIKEIDEIERPLFHATVPVGWMNGFNGFSEYHGEKHIFFQYHPYDTVRGPILWGHMKTSDFIKWEKLPIALAPDKAYDGYGCFSGSAIEWKGKHVLAYTGVERTVENGQEQDYQRQCIAIGDGINYQKIQENPVISGDVVPAGGSVLDFRNPKIWVEGDYIYMVVGNRAEDGSGQILLYQSKDLKAWEYVTILDKCDNRYGKMWEFPDFFPLDGMDVLIVSPQEMLAVEHDFHVGDGNIAILGQYNCKKHEFKEQSIQAVDMGLNFYAPQTMLTIDGRRILVAWLQTWNASWFGTQDGLGGMMTVPRELKIINGRILQNPVKELEKYYTNRQRVESELLKKEFKKFDCLSGRIQNLNIVFEGEDDYIFEMKLAAEAELYTSIRYDRAKKLLTFDRSHSGVQIDASHERNMRVLSNERIVRLRVVMDRYSIELFVNGGEQAMTSIIRTPQEIDGVYMRADGRVFVYAEKNDICMK